MEIFDSTSVIRLSPIHSLNSFDNYSKSDGKSSHGVPTPAMKKSYTEIDITENSSTSSESRNMTSTSNSLHHQGLLRCLECPLTFKDNASLRQHFIETHGNTYGKLNTHSPISTFTCSHCSQLFPCSTTLKVHQTEHVLPNVQQILSSKIPSSQSTTNRLLNITFACQSCPSTFTSRELLVDHANVHLLGHQCDNPSCQDVYSTNKKQQQQQDKTRNTVIKPLRDSISFITSDKNTSNYPSNYHNTTSTNPPLPSQNPPQLFSFAVDKLNTALKNKQSNNNTNNAKSTDHERHVQIREHLLKDHHHQQVKNKPPPPQVLPPSTNNNNNSTKYNNSKPTSVIVSSSSTRQSSINTSHSNTSGGSSAPTEPRIVNCNGKKRFQCKVCHKYLSSKLSHEEHSRVHTGEKPYRCVICVKSYAVKNTYRQHMASHKLGGSGIIISNTTNSGGGGNGNNNINNNGRCPTAENSHILLINTTSPSSTSSPSSTTNNSGKADSSAKKCSSCLTTFSSQDKLDYHTCSTRKMITQCRTSNKRSRRPQNSQPNNLHSSSSSKEGFRCKICGKTFARKEWRKKHYLSHAGESCFRCDICGSIFVDEQIYLIHAQDHFCPSEIKKSFTDCNVCGKVFPGRDLYDRHSCRFNVNSSG